MVYLGFCSEEATQSEQIKLKLNMTRISRREVEETIERRQGCKNSTSFSRHKNGEQLCQNKTLSERLNKIFLIKLFSPLLLSMYLGRRSKMRDLFNPSKETMSEMFFKMGHPMPLFLYFRLSNTQFIVNKCSIEINKFLPMTGFEPQTSGIGSDRFTN